MQKLINSVQNYAWGSKTALTDLYGIANPNNRNSSTDRGAQPF